MSVYKLYKMEVINMCDEKLWKMAREQTIKDYEEECGCWEDADKYEREDWVFSAYMKLKEESRAKR